MRMASMASGPMGETLRHVRDLFSEGTSVGLGDGLLLARYADARDEAAFEALVARHGPMVLATCHAVLRNEHDVDDAFQATFLVLARKARKVRAGDALGGWLHRVAYRAAVQASAESRRRRRREAKATAMATFNATHTEPDPDIAAVVHEELDRLPDRQRLPVVLCDLEGLTYEHAARQLRWTEPTLRHRLVKARQRLRHRLIRRGVTAGAVGVAVVAPATGARAAVPAALAHSAIAAAMGGSSTAPIAALANTIIRSMLMTKLKIASACVLASVALASAGVVAVGAWQTDEPKAAMRASGVANGATAVAPIAPRDADAEPQAPAGTGPGIEGRIVDLEGRPIAGARVEVTDLWSAPDNNLGRWLDQAQDRGVAHPSQGLSPGGKVFPLPTTSRGRSQRSSPSPAMPAATTGPDGRFRLAGVGPEQLAGIRVTGPTIATARLYVMGRDGAEVRATLRQGLTPSQVVYHARKLEYAAAPGKPIEGVVRDMDTGRPIAGVALQAAVYDEQNLMRAPGIEATTDHRGHYRLAGLPRAPAYRLFVEPGGDEPYPNATLRAAGDTPAFEPVTFDILLKRGILVRGKVTDKATGQPVAAIVEVYAFNDNPHLREFPGFKSSGLARSFVVNGRYEIVALPGRGIIGVLAAGWLNRYRRSVGAEAIKGYNPQLTGFHTYPHPCLVSGYHTVAEINLDPKAEMAELDLQIEPGRTIVVTPVDPEGRPVAGTMATGVSDLSSTEHPQPSPTIEICALDPSRPRRVIVTHAGRKLIGSIYLKGDETGPLTIQLQPYGTVTGRIVDDDGRPRGGLGIMSAGGSMPARPAEQGILPGGNIGGGIRIGRDGRFRIEGLVPGLKYGAGASDGLAYGELFHDLTVTPGEVKDLGDLKAVPPNRDN
jgi:RNA polymerase sigma factor (sigma-70 family)